MDTDIERIIGLFPFTVVCFAAGYIGSRMARPSLPVWYARLHKPKWAPPREIFGPVWTLLYLTMAISAWWVWEDKGFTDAAGPLLLFAAQLGLNVFWTYLFFSKRRPDLAFYEVVALWVAIAATIAAFADIGERAAWLMAPYLMWVTFAAVLNYRIWRLNSD